MAAPYFDYVDVAEEHHETKVDAPSGTAMAIARAIQAGHPERFARNVKEGKEQERIGPQRRVFVLDVRQAFHAMRSVALREIQI